MKTSIREITKADYQNVFRCAEIELGEKVDVRKLFYRIRKTKRNAEFKTFLAFWENEIIGFIIVRSNEKISEQKTLEIRGFLLRKEYEHQGIGSELVDYICGYALENDLILDQFQSSWIEFTRTL